MSNDFLYWFGFYVEYRLLCLARGLAAFTRWFVRVLGALLTAVLRPVALGCIQLRQALRRPKAWLGLVVPLAGVLAFAWLVRTWLGQPFALRVELNGTVVGYVASEQDFDTARADVQARVNTARALLEAAGADVPNWDLDPAFTLAVSADTMTPGEVANAILQASGSEITAGTAVYVDGALRFVTTEGDHLRRCLYAVRQLWQTEGVQTDFVHPLRLVDGIYPAVAVTPYGTLLDALRDSGLLQVKVTRYETVTKELPFETQTVEDADLDFGKTEAVQAGQSGSEQVTSEIVTVDGAVVSCQAVDVQLLQAPVPEIIHRGIRLKSGMIGKLGTGSFLWPVPGYSGISRWANLPYGHRGVDITAPYGTPIYAADAGTVIAAQWHNHPTASWGYYVEIDHGNGYKTLYGHMSSFVVQTGQTVTKGQLIGYVGATGTATGNHCHFEMYYNNTLISARNVFPDI